MQAHGRAGGRSRRARSFPARSRRPPRRMPSTSSNGTADGSSQPGRGSTAADGVPADVAVREHEPAPLIRALLREHTVQPDNPPVGGLERPVEQRAPDAVAAQIGAHDVEPDERVRLAVQRHRRRRQLSRLPFPSPGTNRDPPPEIALHRRALDSSPPRPPTRSRLEPHEHSSTNLARDKRKAGRGRRNDEARADQPPSLCWFRLLS
jgi:hypothetical protein